MHRKQIQAKPAERNRRELYRMGLIKAIAGAAGGVMADQWKEYFYCEAMPANILATKGQKKVTGR